MDNNKKGRKYFKNLKSSICKNSGCCGCNSLKKKIHQKNINIEEINNEIVSKEQEINELMDELSKYICPSQLENLFITLSD